MTDPLLTADNAAVLPAVIAAVAAIIAALVAVVGAIYNGRKQRRHEERIERITRSRGERDYRVRQLNELYGPLFMLREQSNRLREQLPPRPWRLVDRIEEIRSNPADPRNQVVNSIVQLNSTMCALITGKAGLLQAFPPPSSFGIFLEHAELLKTYWEMGKNQEEQNRRPFPLEFDDDIRAAIDEVMADLAELDASTRSPARS